MEQARERVRMVAMELTSTALQGFCALWRESKLTRRAWRKSEVTLEAIVDINSEFGAVILAVASLSQEEIWEELCGPDLLVPPGGTTFTLKRKRRKDVIECG